MMPVERITLTVKLNLKLQFLNWNLFDYSDAYILVKRTIALVRQEAGAADRNNKEVLVKNCAPFTDCISKMNNTQVDNAKDNIMYC